MEGEKEPHREKADRARDIIYTVEAKTQRVKINSQREREPQRGGGRCGDRVLFGVQQMVGVIGAGSSSLCCLHSQTA